MRKDLDIYGGNSEYVSLQKALKSSRQDLKRALDGDAMIHHDSVGLGALALSSMVRGIKSGLRVYRRNPVTGTSQGSLTAVNSDFVKRLGQQEMRSVAAGKLPLQATVIGLGSMQNK